MRWDRCVHVHNIWLRFQTWRLIPSAMPMPMPMPIKYRYRQPNDPKHVKVLGRSYILSYAWKYVYDIHITHTYFFSPTFSIALRSLVLSCTYIYIYIIWRELLELAGIGIGNRTTFPYGKSVIYISAQIRTHSGYDEMWDSLKYHVWGIPRRMQLCHAKLSSSFWLFAVLKCISLNFQCVASYT